MKINAYAVHSQKGDLKPFTYTTTELSSFAIRIQVTHCGFCRSDVHLVDNDWGISTYPMVPGHEIIGLVIDVGSRVSAFRKGDRVGVGWQSFSCFSCEMCQGGHENLCDNQKATCLNSYGGFSDYIITDSRFAYIIPNNLSSVDAVPLMCAGATMYSPMMRWNIGPGMRVGIVGMGGLGILGVKFAKALGCDVYAFSGTSNKAMPSKEIGAEEFININDELKMDNMKNSLDFIISTTPGSINWSQYISILKPNGIFCVTGVPQNNIDFHSVMLMTRQKSIYGSSTCNRKNIQEMLIFADRHKIKAETITMPLSECNTALQILRNSHPAYRIVLEVNNN